MCRQYIVNVLIVFFFRGGRGTTDILCLLRFVGMSAPFLTSLFWPTFYHTEVQLYQCEQINAWSQRSSLLAD